MSTIHTVRTIGSALLAASLLAGAAAAAPQNDPADGQGVITIGTDSNVPTRTGTFTGSDGDAVFSQAIAHLQTLGNGGGTLVVLPGRYDFDQPVDLDVDGLVIRGSKSAHLRPIHGGSVGIFRITASNVALKGLCFVDDAVDASAGFSFVRVEQDASGGGVRGLTIRDCLFDLRDTGGGEDVADLCLDMGGDGAAHGNWKLLANTFLLPGLTGAAGRTGALRVIGAAGVQILDNAFRGRDGAVGYAMDVLVVQDSPQAVLCGNSFHDIGTTGYLAVSMISVLSTTAGRGAVLGGNTFDRCLAQQLVLTDAESVVIGSNTMDVPLDGGGLTTGLVGVKLHALTGVRKGGVVFGNQFRGLGSALVIEYRDGTVVSGNVFTQADGTQILATGCEALHIGAESFQSAPNATGPLPAMDVQTSTDVFIYSCDGSGGLWGPLWQLDASTQDYNANPSRSTIF